MRQRFPRYTIQIPVFFRQLDEGKSPQTGIGLTQDLSEGGACLLLEGELVVGCRLDLFMFVEKEIAEAEARVAWIQPRDEATFYHGVEFIQLTPGQHTSILKLLHQGESFRRQSLRLPLTLSVSCQVVGDDTPSIEGQTCKISRTGAEILLPRLVPPHTVVEITLSEPVTTPLLGQVRWAKEVSGGAHPFRHGVEFLRGPLDTWAFQRLLVSTLPEEDRAKLERQLSR
ncbi:MAG: PilZ domain-containing protein [Candidatus Methylomirabilales bacterium]